jgi:NAD+ synthase
MTDLRERILTELGVKPTVVPEAEIRRRVGFLKDYLRSAPAKGYVLAISGGQDSAGRQVVQIASQELRRRTRGHLCRGAPARWCAG